jgi:hypothetical protein
MTKITANARFSALSDLAENRFCWDGPTGTAIRAVGFSNGSLHV